MNNVNLNNRVFNSSELSITSLDTLSESFNSVVKSVNEDKFFIFVNQQRYFLSMTIFDKESDNLIFKTVIMDTSAHSDIKIYYSNDFLNEEALISILSDIEFFKELLSLSGILKSVEGDDLMVDIKKEFKIVHDRVVEIMNFYGFDIEEGISIDPKIIIADERIERIAGYYEKGPDPKDDIIILIKDSKDNMLTALAHEITHLLQTEKETKEEEEIEAYCVDSYYRKFFINPSQEFIDEVNFANECGGLNKHNVVVDHIYEANKFYQRVAFSSELNASYDSMMENIKKSFEMGGVSHGE